MLAVENRAEGAPKGPRKQNERGSLLEVWTALAAMTERLDRIGADHKAALDERDVRIMELQGLVSNQAVVIDQLTVVRSSVQSQLEGMAARFGDIEGMMDARTDALSELVATEIRAFRKEVQTSVETLVENGEAALLELRQAHEGEVAARVALNTTTENTFAAVEARENTLELVLKATGDAADQAHAGLDLQIKSLQDRLAEMRDQTTVRAEDLDQRLTGATARLEDVSENVVRIRNETDRCVVAGSAQSILIDKVVGRVDQVEGTVAELVREGEERGIAIEQLERLVQTETENAVTLRASLDAVAGHAHEIANVVGRVDQAEGTVAALVRESGERATAIEQLDESVRNDLEVVRTLTEEHVSALAARFGQLQAESRSWISKLPKNLIVDSKGDLVAVTGEGDLQVVGRVQGERGLDGATVQDMVMVDGQLQVTMTDGRNLRVQVPLAPAGELDEADPQQLQAQQLQAEGKSFTQIGKELGVDRRKVSKWLRGSK